MLNFNARHTNVIAHHHGVHHRRAGSALAMMVFRDGVRE